MENIEWDDPAVKEFEPNQKYAYVTQRAIDSHYIGFCYREYTDIKIDSGWRFLYGDEDEDYLDNPDNVIAQDLSEVINWKPEVGVILSEKYGSEYEWSEEKGVFEKI
ncbi:immunity protein Imm33 domain-containing protein [Viscerimonas tarda]